MAVRVNSIIVIFFLLAMSASGQDIDANPALSKDTSLKMSFRCLSSYSYGKIEPLVIINRKRIPFNSLQRCFVNISDVESVKVYNSKNDTAKQYGRRAKNGVIIISAKRSISWKSSNSIFRRYDKNLFHLYKKTLIIVDGDKLYPGEKYYFDGGTIKAIKYNNDANEFCLGNVYKRVIYITTLLKSGS